MSAQAMQVLLFWASQVSRKVQRQFVGYYNQKRSAYQNGEMSSGVFEYGDRLITSDGMSQMIESFETQEGLEKTNLDRTP